MMDNTVRAALVAATERLSATGSLSPRLDAEVLLRHRLGWDRTRLFIALPDPLPADAARDYDALIARRAAGEPVAYIVGEREFMGLPFAVGPGVLVPRPETECLVEWIAARVRAEPRWAGGARIVDVGTGSGAIALSLATLLPDARIVGVERSSRALAYARTNRATLRLAGRVGLVQGDLLGPIGAVDVVAANLPYLRTAQAHAGIAQEPTEALYAGEDGLDLYRDLLPQAARLLRAPGLLVAEIDPEQSAAMRALCRAAFPHATITIEQDLAGLDRFVTVQRIESN
jgi:release factor glutamine methyltransferase